MSSINSVFSSVDLAPPDALFGIDLAFKADTHEKKVNLGVGAYRTDEGKTYVFPSVIEAEKRILHKADQNKEYLPIDGMQTLKKLTQTILFGSFDSTVASAQTISGCGALRTAAEVVRQTSLAPEMKAYVSSPTWANHRQVFQHAGYSVQEYPYWNAARKGLDVDGMLKALREIPDGSLLVLHACAHNPTGCDPTQENWRSIAETLKGRKIIIVMDCAYQGFASGSLEEDAWAIRYFKESGLQFFVCQSFAKNMGLYGERAGMIHAVCSSEDEAARVLSKMKVTTRGLVSNPPLHAALILNEVLGDDALKNQWISELKQVAGRIIRVRSLLREGLEKLLPHHDWSHITTQIGMFCFTCFSKEVCDSLTKDYHIYLLGNGRISMAGVNSSNVDYLVRSFADAIKKNEGK